MQIDVSTGSVRFSTTCKIDWDNLGGWDNAEHIELGPNYIQKYEYQYIPYFVSDDH